MTLVLDAGALLAIERGNRELVALLVRERRAERAPITHGGVVGQVWRGSAGRQANLARLLPAMDVRPLDDALGKRAGVLLGRAGASDVVDAAVVLLAADGDEILTTDTRDLEPLVAAARIHADIIAV